MSPHHHTGCPNKSKVTRNNPYSAVLSMTPLKSAETGEGAAGWASGSHTCNGTNPAFAPKPNKASEKAMAAQAGDRDAERIASNVKRQLPPCITPNASRIAMAP